MRTEFYCNHLPRRTTESSILTNETHSSLASNKQDKNNTEQTNIKNNAIIPTWPMPAVRRLSRYGISPRDYAKSCAMFQHFCISDADS